MLPASSKYAGQHLAILGMGASGMGAARLARHLGAEVTLLDDGPSDKTAEAARVATAEGFAVHTGEAALRCGSIFNLAVFSPGVDPSSPLAQHLEAQGVPRLAELEFAFQQTHIPVIGITGTNGKTTVTGLIAHLINASGRRTVACGNYGPALSEIVLGGEPLDVLTVEVSSFQLELIRSFRPVVAVWMNFAPDHLDRHPDIDSYRRAKLRIFENQQATDAVVINGAETYPPLKGHPITFSAWREDTDWTLHEGVIRHQGTQVITQSETALQGRHNAENIMAALAAVTAWGLPLELAAAHVSGYTPPRHRCEAVATIHGRAFVNDSKATNIHAMESALRGQDKPVVLIAGGKEKGLDYAPLLPLIREKTTQVFTIGEIGASLAQCWPGAVQCADLEAAVRAAYGAAAPGQTILFSPGTSSFDMFTGYTHRGDVFCQIVQQLQSTS